MTYKDPIEWLPFGDQERFDELCRARMATILREINDPDGLANTTANRLVLLARRCARAEQWIEDEKARQAALRQHDQEAS